MNDPVDPEPVVVRARSDNDLGAMIEVRVRADPHAPPPRLENLRHNLAGNPDLAYLVARVGDSPVGCGFVDVSTEAVARAHILVVPDARGRGIGSSLLVAVSDAARAGRRSALEGPIRADDQESIDYFARRGFEHVGGEEAVALDLSEAEPLTPEPPAGVRIVSRAEMPDVVDAMYAVACEAEPDIPGGGPVRSFDLWRATEIDRPTLQPELTFVALVGHNVVGYAILDSLGADSWHRLTGVRRAWRRRGIATALKRAQICAAKERGLARLVTMNEERNKPMRSLNETLGYRTEPSLSTVVLRGPLLRALAISHRDRT
jgi:mycothiol synthase